MELIFGLYMYVFSTKINFVTGMRAIMACIMNKELIDTRHYKNL